jgi:hypothetical protein
MIDHYEHQILELKSRIARLDRSPHNSSLPPSSQHPLGMRSAMRYIPQVDS